MFRRRQRRWQVLIVLGGVHVGGLEDLGASAQVFGGVLTAAGELETGRLRGGRRHGCLENDLIFLWWKLIFIVAMPKRFSRISFGILKIDWFLENVLDKIKDDLKPMIFFKKKKVHWIDWGTVGTLF